MSTKQLSSDANKSQTDAKTNLSERKKRLGAALRDNLRKRKNQSLEREKHKTSEQ